MSIRNGLLCLLLFALISTESSVAEETDSESWFLDIGRFVSQEQMLLALDMDLGNDLQLLMAQLDSTIVKDRDTFKEWALLRYEVLHLRDALINDLGVPHHNELAITNSWNIAEMRASTYDWEYSQSFPFTDDEIAVAMVRGIFQILREHKIDLAAMHHLATYFFEEFGGRYQEDALYHFSSALSLSVKSLSDGGLEGINDYSLLSLREIKYLELIGDLEAVKSRTRDFDIWINQQKFSEGNLSTSLLIDTWKIISKFLNGNRGPLENDFIDIRRRVYLSFELKSKQLKDASLAKASLQLYRDLLENIDLDDHARLVDETALYLEYVILSNGDQSAYDALVNLQSNAIRTSIALQDLESLIPQLESFKSLVEIIKMKGVMQALNEDSLFEIDSFLNDPALSNATTILLCSQTDDCQDNESIFEWMANNYEGSASSYFEIAPLIINDQLEQARNLFNSRFIDTDVTEDCSFLMKKASLGLDLAEFSYFTIRKNIEIFESTFDQILKDIEIARNAYARLSVGKDGLQSTCEISDGLIAVNAPIHEAYLRLLRELWLETVPSDFGLLSVDLNEVQYMRVRNRSHNAGYKDQLVGIDSLLITGFSNLLMSLDPSLRQSVFESKVRANQDIVDRFAASCAQLSMIDNTAGCISLLPVAHSLKTYSSRSNNILLNTIKAAEGLSLVGGSVSRISDIYELAAAVDSEKLNLGASKEIIKNLKDLNRKSLLLEDEIVLERESISAYAPSTAELLQSRLVDAKRLQDNLKADEVLMFTFPKIFSFSQDFYVIGIIETDGIRVKAISAHGMDKRVTAIFKTVEQRAPYDYKSAYLIYNEIFNDVIDRKTLNSVKRDITFIGSDALDSIPLRLLITHNPEDVSFNPRKSWLYQKVNIKRSTTLRQFLSTRILNKRDNRSDRFLGVGNPYLASSKADLRGLKLVLQDSSNQTRIGLSRLPSLPDTEIEIREISKYFADEPQSILLLGKAASETNLKSLDIKQYGTIAFATHGLLSSDVVGLDEPALLLTPPSESSEKDDGLLTAEEISKMDMRADLVILSACNTNVEDINSGSALANLSQAFMLAGATSIMATHWSVESKIATFMTTNTVSRLIDRPADGISGALNHAIELARQRPEWQHPFFWAPFSIYGDNAFVN